jgi:hypothetical protein
MRGKAWRYLRYSYGMTVRFRRVPAPVETLEE